MAEEHNARAERWGKRQDVLIQVDGSGDQTKRGLTPGEVPGFARRVLLECPQLQVRGLMTMAPLAPPEEARPVFRETRLLNVRLQIELGFQWDSVSLGMTIDFEVAIEEGATLVRIGAALFA